MSDQPTALVLADALDARVVPRWVHATGQTPRQNGFTPDAECVKAATELRRLVAENEALKADAARYRWLRDTDGNWGICEWEDGWYRDARAPHVVDAAIDAAMKESK